SSMTSPSFRSSPTSRPSTSSSSRLSCSLFFFNDTAPTEIYTLSLHDALPISGGCRLLPRGQVTAGLAIPPAPFGEWRRIPGERRSEEHTSELQSLTNLVCRLLLEKKKSLRPTGTQPNHLTRPPLRSALRSLPP